MKHIWCLMVSVLFSAAAFTQISTDTVFAARVIAPDHMEFFTDSLQQKILSDRIYFDKADLFISKFSKETINRKPYSSLLVINNKYAYRLDIIESAGVGNVVYQYLDYKKISNITVFNEKVCRTLYGNRCTAGAIFITMKKDVKFNPAIAGLKKKTKNNFIQDYKDIPVLWQ